MISSSSSVYAEWFLCFFLLFVQNIITVRDKIELQIFLLDTLNLFLLLRRNQ